MTGLISTLPIAIVAVLVAASMVAGAIDIVRQPGWAWTQVEESKPAYFILDLLLPVIGLAMYAFRARPKLVAAVAAGNTSVATAEPQRPTEQLSEETRPNTPATTASTAAAATAAASVASAASAASVAPAASTDRFTGFREVANTGHPGPWESDDSTGDPEPFEVSSTFFSTGPAGRTMRHPLALARAYRPRQRTSLAEDQPEPVPEPVPVDGPEPEPVDGPEPEPVPEPERAHGSKPMPEPRPAPVVAHEAPTVPSGWKTDPTGRHQFRYWDGTHWTENVADDGQESRDALERVTGYWRPWRERRVSRATNTSSTVSPESAVTPRMSRSA